VSSPKYIASLTEDCKIELKEFTAEKGTPSEFFDSFRCIRGIVQFNGVKGCKEVPIECVLGFDPISFYQQQCQCKINQQSGNTGGGGDITVTAVVDFTDVLAKLEALCSQGVADATLQAQILSCITELKNQTPEKQRYRIIDRCEYILKDDQKLDNPPITQTIIYEDCETDPPTLIEVEEGQPIENLFDNTNYIKMSRLFGSRDVSPIQQFKSKSWRVTVAMTGAPVDIVATIQAKIDAAIASLTAKGVVIPDGATLKPSCITAVQHPDKKLVYDDIADADATVTSDGQVKHVEVKAGDLTAEGPAGSFIEYCYDVACYAAAPGK